MQLKLSKYIIQVRFRTSLTYFEKMFQRATLLESEFEHFKANHNPSEVVLFDESLKMQVNITPNSISVTTEDNKIAKDMPNLIKKYLSIMIEDANITDFLHVGFRKINIYETTFKYQDYVDKFYDTFYGSREEMKEFAADSISDVAYILEGVKNGASTRVRLGPIKPEQLEQYFTFEEYVEKKPTLTKETNILVDSDAYFQNITDLETIIDLFDDVFVLNTDIYDSTLSYLIKKTC